MSTSWTCGRCGVVASFAEDTRSAPPDGWADVGDGWRCLACRRQDALDAALPAGGAGSGAARRRVLIEFELTRDPEAADREIARRAKCPTHTVAPVRAALLEDGRLDASVAGDGG